MIGFIMRHDRLEKNCRESTLTLCTQVIQTFARINWESIYVKRESRIYGSRIFAIRSVMSYLINIHTGGTTLHSTELCEKQIW